MREETTAAEENGKLREKERARSLDRYLTSHWMPFSSQEKRGWVA